MTAASPDSPSRVPPSWSLDALRPLAVLGSLHLVLLLLQAFLPRLGTLFLLLSPWGGIALAAMLIIPGRGRLLFPAGAVLAHFVVGCLGDQPAPLAWALDATGVIAAAGGSLLITALAGPRFRVRRSPEVIALLATAVAAGLASSLFWIGVRRLGHLTASTTDAALRTHWMAVALGMLLIPPALVMLLQTPRRSEEIDAPPRRLETGALAALGLACIWFTLGPLHERLPIPFHPCILMLPLALAAYRLRARDAILILTGLGVVELAVSALQLHFGFERGEDSGLSIQFGVASQTAVAMLVLAIRSENRLAQDALVRNETRLHRLTVQLRDHGFGRARIHPDGRWEWLEFDQGLERLRGLRRDQLRANPGVLDSQIHEADREGLNAAREACLRTGTETATSVRMQSNDGDLRRLRIELFPQGSIDDDGALEVEVVETDVTELRRTQEALKASEEKFMKVFRGSPAALALRRLSDGMLIDASVSMEGFTGYSRAELMRRPLKDMGLWYDEEEQRQIFGELQRTGRVTNRPFVFQTAQGRLVSAQFSGELVELNGERCVLAAVTDVSALKDTRQELQRVNRALRTLSDCSQIVANARDEETLLRQQCQAIVSSGGYLFAWVGYAEQDTARTVSTRASAGGPADFTKDWPVSWGDNEYGRGPAGIALRTGRPVACTDLLHDSRLAPWWDRIRTTPARSMVVLPIRVGDEVIGALTICTSELNSFGAEELKLLVRLADDLGFGIRTLRERARKEAAEVDVRRLLKEAENSRAVLLSILEDQIRSEAALRISEERFRSALEHSPIGMALVDLDGRWLMVNQALCSLLGHPRERILGSGFLDFTHPEDREPAGQRMAALLDGAIDSYELEKRYVHAAGPILWARVNMSLIRNPDRTPRHFIKQIQDITERRHAEQSLLELNRRYARHEAALSTLSRSYALAPEDLGKVLREIAEVVAWTLDVERVSVWTYIRSRSGMLCLELFERTGGRHSEGREMERRGHESYFAAMEASEVIAVASIGSDPRTAGLAATPLFKSGPGALLNTPIRSRDGKSGALCCEHLGESRAWTSDEQTFAIAVANLLSLIFAQIEEQKLQAQLRHTQKLEALGTLAGGIAHDFNNILGAIISFTELARMDHPADAELQENLGEVIKACGRATGLVRQILAFSRRQDPVRVPIQLTPVVQEALKLIRSTLPAGIEIESRIDEHLPCVLADANQIHQVLVNLCANAEHAMRGRSGLLKVSLAMKPGTTAANRMVQITISDTGHGMSDAVMRRIFDPFFTTKGPGEGTGLGLAVVHGILEEHRGTIDVESTVGAGSTFRIALPVCESPDTHHAAEPVRRVAGNGERILFVDDETALLHSASQLLEYQGFRVESFGDPEAALDLIRREPTRFDAVITDLAMPRVNGMDVARQILQIAPHLPVLMMTGYAGEMTADVVKAVGIVDLILKPIDFPTLAAKLAAACARSAKACGESQAPPPGT